MHRSRSLDFLPEDGVRMELEMTEDVPGARGPVPMFTSTPGSVPGAKPGGRSEYPNPYPAHKDSLGGEGRVYVDVTDLRIQHLTELLENEKRAVRLLSHFSNVNLGSVGSGRVDSETGRSKSDWFGVMPELENMALGGGTLGARPKQTVVGGPTRGGLTAQEVYNQTWDFDKLLKPEKPVPQFMGGGSVEISQTVPTRECRGGGGHPRKTSVG